MKILCTGDLHLDRWPQLAPVDRLADHAENLARIVALARQEEVQLVLLAGDVFNTPRPPADVLVLFRTFVEALLVGGCDVIAIAGNVGHDQESPYRPCPLEVFEQFDDPMFRVSRRPELLEVGGIGVCTVPSVPVTRLAAAQNGGDRDAINVQAARAIEEIARGLRAGVDGPAVLLCHWAIGGAVTTTGQDVGVFREPVIDLEALRPSYDAIVAGHIHEPQMLDDDPASFYVGSPMPLNHGEAGDHGVWILTLLDGVTPQPGHARFEPIRSRPFETIEFELDPDGPPFEGDFEIGAIVRLRVKATAEEWRKAKPDQWRDDLLKAGAARVTIEPIIERQERARVQVADVDQVSELGWVERWAALNDLEAPPLVERTRRYLGGDDG